jgi:hypothetical protein
MFRHLTLAVLLASTLAFAQNAPTGTVNVLTRQNDNQHTGQNLHETILTPANVNSGSFGKVFSYPVDGQIYAEPLYVSGLTMAQGGITSFSLPRSTTASTLLTPKAPRPIRSRCGM